ncbi:hypothetical protein [Bradyrhizobium canariense]|uniref:Uncharacterized protein n=1 Tax=Bradyrhizobium canariense TaxID=255045 RepID=A0A1X3FPN0_9BRAD|nr:hypothetical protein [Bradyrhizobium canariense]OSI68625.1 hypothetical protein BSZ22_20920 [Bradyrhizobium canariense]OSI78073.1 hypothetical protein BSZ23_19920 [Bradyrhizobium canariense]OSI89303.1 hypothetical protein BSZ25_21390 [Bradyrhizobium canariense]OSI93132.1 hypothetical protein BSZ24_13510 [Bradyrhizobium canariense]OSJ03102.1 hypothetical protein BSZ16_16815 [Bradyrhizobium canariense]
MLSNHDDSTAIIKNKVGETETGSFAMEAMRRFRAMALLCRQAAVRDPERSWKLLAEAEYWEHLAAAALVH